MAHAIRYEDIQEYYYGSAHAIAFILKTKRHYKGFRLLWRAWRMREKTRKNIPEILQFMEDFPEYRISIAEMLQDLHDLLMDLLAEYEKKGNDKIIKASYELVLEMAHEIEDCLESAQISSNPELMEVLGQIISEQPTASSPDWRKNLAQL